MIKKDWDLKQTIKNFLKPSTRLLYVGENKAMIYSLNHSYSLTGFNDENTDNIYDVVVYDSVKYDIQKVSTLLADKGHLITVQNGSEHDIMLDKSDIINTFNLENEAEKLSKSGYSIVRCNQKYKDEIVGNTIKREHKFFILAKKYRQ